MSTLWGGQLSGSGSTHWGVAGLGVRGADVPSTGTHGPALLYQHLNLPTDNDNEFYWVPTTVPSSGTLTLNEDSSFSLVGAADGLYTLNGTWYKDGASQGASNNSIQIGPVTLDVVDDTQANLSSGGAFSQVHILGGGASTQAALSSGGAFTQVHQLGGSSSTQAALSTGGAIDIPAPGTVTLGTGTSIQAALASAGGLTQAHALGGGSSTQGALSAGSGMAQIHQLGAGASTQAALSTGGAIGIPAPGTINLGSSNSTAANGSSATGLSQVHSLGNGSGLQAALSSGGAIVIGTPGSGSCPTAAEIAVAIRQESIMGAQVPGSIGSILQDMAARISGSL